MSLKIFPYTIGEEYHNLWNYFIENCSESPGSSYNHQAWKGGYFDHILQIMKIASDMFPLLNIDNTLDFSEITQVLFLHDIEKPIKYTSTPHRLDFLKEESDNAIRFKLMDIFNIHPSEKILDALKFIHGEGNEYRKDKRMMSELSTFCHCCDVISARIFHNKIKI